MRRRDFIGFAVATVAAATRADALQAEPRRRVGVLQPQQESDGEAQAWVGAFRARLAELGWQEGDNLDVDYRWYGGDLERLKRAALELVTLRPDVVFGMSTPTIAALQETTHSVPIVFVNANNPVGSGFVASLSRPGGNITGFVAFEPTLGGKWVELLRQLSPGLARVGLLYNPQTHTGQYFQSIDAASRVLAVEVARLPFNDASELERALEGFAREPRGGVIVLPDSSTRVHRDLIVSLAARHRLPAVYAYRLFITSGGLAYYGTSTIEQFRKAADYVDRILRGAAPGELPVQAPTEFELVINLGAAKALGLDVPVALLAQASEVIE